MPRYIDADELLALIPTIEDEYKYCRKIINNMPTADVREVVRGEWISKWHPIFKTELPICSACNSYTVFDSWNFCPNCGADMRGDTE